MARVGSAPFFDLPAGPGKRKICFPLLALAHAKYPTGSSGAIYSCVSTRWWLRGLDLNQRPSGYEPDELPDCSTPRHRLSASQQRREKGYPRKDSPLTCEWVFVPRPYNPSLRWSLTPAAMPGGVLLFQRLSVSTIGAAWFHGRVRDGIGWVTGAMTTKQ